jgi:CheY-like chemotaxis protein
VGSSDGPPAHRTPLAGLAVLVVEDDAVARAAIATCLEVLGGAAVSTAASAEEALEVVQRDVPGVLVCDMSMPQYDGLWLIEHIRALPAARGGRLPAIALTGHGFIYGRDRVIGAGFQERLRKPFDPWQLCTVIAHVTGAARVA